MTLTANKHSPQSPQDTEIQYNYGDPGLFSKSKLYSRAYILNMSNFFTSEIPELENFTQEQENINLIRFNH